MKFIEKKDKDIEKINCGDYILFSDGLFAIVTEYGREYTLVFLDDGYFSHDYVSDTLEDLLNTLKLCNKDGIRIIKTENIVINEI